MTVCDGDNKKDILLLETLILRKNKNTLHFSLGN